MEAQIWSDVDVDVQTVLAAAKTITGITKASPAVVSSTAHGYAVGDILLLKIKGMLELDYAVVKVTAQTTDSFTLAGIDSTLFGTFTSGTAQKITFGAAAATFTDITPSGGEASQVVIQTIHVSQSYSKPGNVSALTFAFGSLWMPDDPALIELQAASRSRTVRAVRFTFADGTAMFFAGYPSVSMAPGGAAGAIVTTPVSINVRGPVQPYVAP